MGAGPHLTGSPAERRRRPSGRTATSGFSTVIVRMPAPYDRETIERIGEVARGARADEGRRARRRRRRRQAGRGPGRPISAPDLTVVVNTGDDLERHGLAVWPDHDTVMYTLAGLDDEERGWGVARRDLGRHGRRWRR